MRGEWCHPHGCSSCLLCSALPFFISFWVRTAQSTVKLVEGQRKTNVFSATPDSSCMTTCVWVRWSTKCTLHSPHAPRFHVSLLLRWQILMNVVLIWIAVPTTRTAWTLMALMTAKVSGIYPQRYFITNTHGLTIWHSLHSVDNTVLLLWFVVWNIALLFLQNVIRPVLAVWVEELPAVRNVLLVSDLQAWDA